MQTAGNAGTEEYFIQIARSEMDLRHSEVPTSLSLNYILVIVQIPLQATKFCLTLISISNYKKVLL